MTTLIRSFIDNLKRIITIEESLKELQKESLNGITDLGIAYYGKVVFEDADENTIYRIEQPAYVIQRLALYDAATELGIQEIFEKEEVVENTDLFIATRQNKLEEWHFTEMDPEKMPTEFVYHDETSKQLSYRLFNDYPELYDKILYLFNRYEIDGVTRINAGVGSDGKLKLFDWYGNYWTTTTGEILPSLYDEEEQEEG